MDARTELIEVWRTRGITRASAVTGTDETISRRDLTTAETVVSDPIHDLPPPQAQAEDIVEIGEVIGKGGMGVVRVGWQSALKREVAVKELRPGSSEATVAALFREAWLAGSLEHPNVVPIHALFQAAGSPVLVMKRIEGTSWTQVLYDPEAAAQFEIEDPLEFHLHALMTVCRAVHFAHSRGIVHLDLKPDNVMVGRFGEVYVLDWGVAASLIEEGRPHWMPYAKSIRSVCGTPAYLAPEMAIADGEAIGVRTDVYLLGAVLHEVLTKKKRHDGTEIIDVLAKAYESPPYDYPSSVPAELAAIANRACARAPADRYPSAEAFRRAIEDFLKHRSSSRLADAALDRLELIHESEASDASSLDAMDQIALQRAFTECRFAFQQALEIWADNGTARQGLQDLLVLMAERAIRDRQPTQAAACLEELPIPVPELEARLSALRDELVREAEEAEALKRLGQEVDLTFHRKVRQIVAGIIALVWIVWNPGIGYLFRNGILEPSYVPLMISVGGTVLICGTGMWFIRNTLMRHKINRRAVLLFGSGIVNVFLFWLGCWLGGVDVWLAIGLSPVIYTGVMLAMALTVDRGAFWAALWGVPAMILGPVYKDYAPEIAGAVGFFMGLTMVWVWRKDSPGADLEDIKPGESGISLRVRR